MGNVLITIHGFIDNLEKQNHFQDHEMEFNPPFPSADAYETRAVAFLAGPMTGTMEECTRRNGDVIRYDTATNEFAICNRDGILRTYYRPDPVWHRKASNLTYFREQCGK